MSGSEDGCDLSNERDGEIKGDNNKRDGEYKEEEEEDEEDGMAESNNNSFSFSADEQEQMNVANDDGGQSDVAAALASGRQASDEDRPNVAALLAGKRSVGEAASFKEMRDGGQKKAVPLLCPLKPQGKSLPVIWATAIKMDFCSKTLCAW
jgi:hypothetical protein